MAKRNLYLNNTPIDDALKAYIKRLENIVKAKAETISVQSSLNRITSNAVYAKYCSPLFNAAAMDGIAVVSKNTKGASEINPMVLKDNIDFIPVDTGDPIKQPYDAVIMAEDIIENEDKTISIIESAAPWQHIRPIGEDIVAGEMLVPSRHKIRPIDIAVMLSGGICDIEVVKKPNVAIFPTGTEIIEAGVEPKEGDIIESNSYMFKALLEENSAIGDRFSPIADDFELLKNKIKEATSKYDMVIVNAGSSAGREDFTVHALRELGEVIIHGVAIKPGKPVILAIVNEKPVIGLPGYPVSAYIDFEEFVLPILALINGEKNIEEKNVKAVISKRLVSSLKHKEYVRVRVGKVNNRLVASPLARGAGAAMSLVRADGFCIIEQNSEGVSEGEEVNVQLYRSLNDIDNTVVAVGSHDLILDVIADIMPTQFLSYNLSATHLGSLGGLMALKRGEAHIAPSHLLDEKTGIYNISYIKRIFTQPMAIIKGVGRIQGIMVQKGNPLNIKGIEDLINVRYINRQRGAGTRVFFDHLLAKGNIDSENISGYDMEAATHMAVAAAIQGDTADAGMGIESAAMALGLDFIAIGEEEYDFVVMQEYLEMESIKAFIGVLKSHAFKENINKLFGYQYNSCGEIIYI